MSFVKLIKSLAEGLFENLFGGLFNAKRFLWFDLRDKRFIGASKIHCL